MKTTWTMAVMCLAGLVLAAGCDMGGATGGPAGWWPMDEGSALAVKNKEGVNDGKIEGGLKWVDGKSGKALSFNGKGYVVIDTANYLSSPQYTFTAWVNLKDTGDHQYIVWRGGPEFPEAKECRNLDIWLTTDGRLSGIVDPKAGGGRIQMTGTIKVADGKWHHVACVIDGKKMTFFVDGKKDVEENLPGPLADNNFPLWIGARPGDVAATGIIDEVKFYTRALSPEELTTK